MSFCVGSMRSEENPLDLNNLPEDHARDGKVVSCEDSSSSSAAAAAGVHKKKKSGSGGGKEEAKMYECRFCSLKFYKSQALGGHMNRHRQERETETLTKARQLVFTNDLGYVSTRQAMPLPAYDDDKSRQLPFRPMYSTRLFPPPPPYMCTTTSSQDPPCFQSQFPPSPSPTNYLLGRVISNQTYGGEGISNYTCIGAPVPQGYILR